MLVSIAPARAYMWCKRTLTVGRWEYGSRNVHSCLCWGTGWKAIDVRAHRQAEVTHGVKSGEVSARWTPKRNKWDSKWQWTCHCWLVSAVHHKGLHQGWKQTSIHLQVIESTSYYATSLFFPNHNSNSIHNFGTQTRRIMTHFWSLFIFFGTQHENLHPVGWPILFCRPTQ